MDESINQSTATCRSETPLAQWTSDDVVGWLHDLGLHQYAGEARRWKPSGRTLLECPAGDLDKELALKHALHRKKLLLALEAKGRPQDPASPMPLLPGNLT